jgi:hypothetical protein
MLTQNATLASGEEPLEARTADAQEAATTGSKPRMVR